MHPDTGRLVDIEDLALSDGGRYAGLGQRRVEIAAGRLAVGAIGHV